MQKLNYQQLENANNVKIIILALIFLASCSNIDVKNEVPKIEKHQKIKTPTKKVNYGCIVGGMVILSSKPCEDQLSTPFILNYKYGYGIVQRININGITKTG